MSAAAADRLVDPADHNPAADPADAVAAATAATVTASFRHPRDGSCLISSDRERTGQAVAATDGNRTVPARSLFVSHGRDAPPNEPPLSPPPASPSSVPAATAPPPLQLPSINYYRERENCTRSVREMPSRHAHLQLPTPPSPAPPPPSPPMPLPSVGSFSRHDAYSRSVRELL